MQSNQNQPRTWKMVKVGLILAMAGYHLRWLTLLLEDAQASCSKAAEAISFCTRCITELPKLFKPGMAQNEPDNNRSLSFSMIFKRSHEREVNCTSSYPSLCFDSTTLQVSIYPSPLSLGMSFASCVDDTRAKAYSGFLP